MQIFLVAGCDRGQEDQQIEVPRPDEYILTYTVAENGSIEGPARQVVEQGSDGQPVTAVPADHYHFTEWSDGHQSATRADRNVTSDLTVEALFAIDRHSLSYSVQSDGFIEGPSVQKVPYGGSGKVVKAVPTEGYHFVGWSDGVETAERVDEAISDDKEVIAFFAITEYTLEYRAAENGNIEGQQHQVVEHGGDGIAVVAKPAPHYHFVKWSDGVTSADRAEHNVKGNIEATALFAIDQYTLSYKAGDHGSIEGRPVQEVPHGGHGSAVKALPQEGYHFTGWSDGLKTAERLDRNMTDDLEVTAHFAINKYSVKYSADTHGVIEGIQNQDVVHGEDASPVTAVPEKGYHFLTWSDGIETARRIDREITESLEVSAQFAVNTYSLGGTVSGLIEGTELVLQNSDGDELLIATNGEFQFADELLNEDAYDVSVLIQPTAPNQICTVTNGTGRVSTEDVTTIEVTCVPRTYTIGGDVSGLPEKNQVELQNNEGDTLLVQADGPFLFDIQLDDGSEYHVRVLSQPQKENWTCEVENGQGTVAGEDIDDIVVDCFPMVVVEATAGIRKVKLDWNSQDFNEVTFNLCRSQEKMIGDGLKDCLELKDGVIQTDVNDPYDMTGLLNDISYWFQLEARYKTGRRTLSEPVEAIPFGGLNDSGIDWCGDEKTNQFLDRTRTAKTETCHEMAGTHPGQDALTGRDALARLKKLEKTGSGSAGFDFTKLCRNGDAAGEGRCPPNPSPGPGSQNWGCTQDHVTGLIWEIKTEDGLQASRHTYSWFNPDDQVNGGTAGVKAGGECSGAECDTYHYVQSVNKSKLCGISDWRLPTRKELLSIVDNGQFKPSIDTRFFPKTEPFYFWSSSPFADDENSAWQVHFLYGETYPEKKKQARPVRLVSGRTATFGLNNPLGMDERKDETKP